MYASDRTAAAVLTLLLLAATAAYAHDVDRPAGPNPRPAAPVLSADTDALALEAARTYQSLEYDRAAAMYEDLVKRVPSDPTYLVLLAKCRSRTGRGAEALELLQRAEAAGFDLDIRFFERGRALFAAERYAEAVAAYEEYHRRSAGDTYSRLAWCEALIAAERYQEGLDALDQIQPDTDSRVRHEILTAAALTGLERRDEAMSRLQGVLTQDFTETERLNISGTIDMIRQPPRVTGVPGKPWWVALTAGPEYDTNVPTLGKLPKPRNPRHSDGLDAWRASFSLDSGYRWQATDKLAFTPRLFGLMHVNDRLSDRDIVLGRFGLSSDYRVSDEVTVGADGGYSHLWLDQGHLDSTFSAGAFVSWRETSWTASRVSFQYRWETYYDEEVLPTEDLDGTLDTITFAQEFLVPDTTLGFRISYAHENAHTDGSDFDYDSDTLTGSVSYVLPWDIRANASYTHIHTTYHHPNLRDGFDTRRMNNTQIYNVGLSREIVPGLDASLYYTLTDAESNVKDFDFDRNIYGFSLTWRF